MLFSSRLHRTVALSAAGLALSSTTGGIGVRAASSNSPTTKTMCEQFDGALTESGTYLYGTNQWGMDSSGAQCMTVSPDLDLTESRD